MYELPAHPVRFSVFSHSLGDHSVHSLPAKLSAAAAAGFTAVEISLVDLEHHARGSSLIETASDIGHLCTLLGLRVVCLQPLRDTVEARETGVALAKARALFPVMDALGTDLLLCCSSSLGPDEIDGRPNQMISNLRAIGEAAAGWVAPKRVAFEALCWGTNVSTWAEAWKVVQAVDLANVGLCVDAFNTLAREWADPTVKGGIQPDADARLLSSLAKLGKVPGGRIFLLQIGDGRRLPEAIPVGTRQRPALMTWSRSSRLFPMESSRGGYMPVQAFVRTVLETGYEGPWSVEVFNDSLLERDEAVPMLHATRALEGLLSLKNALLGPLTSVDQGAKKEIGIAHAEQVPALIDPNGPLDTTTMSITSS